MATSWYDLYVAPYVAPKTTIAPAIQPIAPTTYPTKTLTAPTSIIPGWSAGTTAPAPTGTAPTHGGTTYTTSASTPLMKTSPMPNSAPYNATAPATVTNPRIQEYYAQNAANNAAIEAGGGSMGPAPTYAAPKSAAQLYQQYSGLLGNFTGVADQFAAVGPQSIQGLGQDYFNQQRDLLKERLRQDFFGPLGTLQQTASGESAAGRLGSGVGQRVLSEAALTPYARAQGEYDTQFANLFQQEQARVQEFNATQMNSFQDRLAQLRANDQGVQVQLQDLAMRSADAEAGRLSQQAIAQLESDLRVWEAATEAELKRRELLLQEQRNAIDYIGTPIDPNKMTTEQRETAAGIFN